MHGTMTAPPGGRAPLLLRLTLRNLRGGLAGFGIFLTCIALGVAAITGVGSLARSLSDGLAREGRTILGADASFSLMQRELDPDETRFLGQRGTVSKVAGLRAMARRGDDTSALIDLKAVGPDYPALGTVALTPAMPLAEALAPHDGVFGMVADPALLARLDLKPGDRLSIGGASLELRAALNSEPDKLAGGLALGPRVLVSLDALAATGLVQPGSLVRWTYRVLLPGPAPGVPATDAAVDTLAKDAKRAFPDAGWEARTRTSVSPQFSRNLERFTQFLTLVGLTALVVGGVGVANAVTGFVERRRPTIATLKALGATGSFVFALMLAEVMAIACLGMAIGLVVGAALPFGVAALAGTLIPFPMVPSIYPGELALGLLYGLLTALAFALGPLGRTHDVSVAALFRDSAEPDRRLPRPRYVAMTVGAAGALAAARNRLRVGP